MSSITTALWSSDRVNPHFWRSVRLVACRISSCLTLVALCSSLSMVLPGRLVSAAEPHSAQVGQVALAVGQALRVGRDGTRSPIRPGDPLYEEDRLITGFDAMVMIVFVDQARLSLRPDTEVLIRRYRIDTAGPDTRLDLELIRGTVRQISGEVARRQPERYRLNTPIATIGVRGTDFLARASSSKVETYIHEGMIVVLPPGEQCRKSCPVLASSSAADAGRYLQVFQGGIVERSFVPPEDVERLFGIRLAAVRDRDGATSRSTAAVFPAPANGLAGLPAIMPLIFADPQAGASRLSEVRAVIPPSVAGVATSPIPAGAYNTPGSAHIGADMALAALPTTLVWGRFSEPSQIPVSMALSYDEARQARHVTVGELGQYALWRNDPRGTLMPALTGQATFSLAAAESFYRTVAGNETASVGSAKLSADFELSRFSTELALRIASGVSTILSATGIINDEGVFVSVAPDGSQRVAGAFSRNGTEAGYLFNKVVGGGVFQGVTLWGGRR